MAASLSAPTVTFTSPVSIRLDMPISAPEGSKVVFTTGTLSTNSTPNPTADSEVWTERVLSSSAYYKWAVLTPTGQLGPYATSKFTFAITNQPPIPSDPTEVAVLKAQLDAMAAANKTLQDAVDGLRDEKELIEAEKQQLQGHLEEVMSDLNVLQDAVNATDNILRPLITPGS